MLWHRGSGSSSRLSPRLQIWAVERRRKMACSSDEDRRPRRQNNDCGRLHLRSDWLPFRGRPYAKSDRDLKSMTTKTLSALIAAATFVIATFSGPTTADVRCVGCAIGTGERP